MSEQRVSGSGDQREGTEAHERIWASLPNDLPAAPFSSDSFEVERVEKLPSHFKMYRSLLLRRRPSLKRGESLPLLIAETDLTVDPDWLTRYREICEWSEIPHADALPITVPQVFAAPLQTYLLADKRFPLSSLGIVHAGNEIIASEPIAPQTKLTLCAWIGETRWRERGVEFDIHTSARKADTDHVVWRARTTVFRAIKSAQDRSKRREPRPATPTLIGEHTALRLSADLGRRYAPVAGDHNPIHLYPITAKLFGFRRPIVHGMWTLARALGGYAQHLSSDPSVLPEHAALCTGALSVRFKRPLLLPSQAELILSASTGERAGHGLTLQVLDAQSKVAIEGAMRLFLERDVERSLTS